MSRLKSVLCSLSTVYNFDVPSAFDEPALLQCLVDLKVGEGLECGGWINKFGDGNNLRHLVLFKLLACMTNDFSTQIPWKLACGCDWLRCF